MADDPRPCHYKWREMATDVVHVEEMTVGAAIERGLNDMRRPSYDRAPLGIFSLDGHQIVSQTRLADLMAERDEEEAKYG